MPNAAATLRIAAAVHQLRPDWPESSIRTLIETDRTLAAHTFQDLAVALAYVATDPATKTPARVRENGPWWAATRAAVIDPTSAPVGRHDPRCPIHPWAARKCGACRSEWLATGQWPEGTNYPEEPNS